MLVIAVFFIINNKMWCKTVRLNINYNTIEGVGKIDDKIDINKNVSIAFVN